MEKHCTSAVVGSSSPPFNCGLVRQVGFKSFNMLTVQVSERCWEKVEYLRSFHSKRCFPGMSNSSWRTSPNSMQNNSSASSCMVGKGYSVSFNKTLRQLPQEEDYLSVPSLFLGAHLPHFQLLPVVHLLYSHHIGGELVLGWLYLVYGLLVPRRPKLATIIQLMLDKSLPDCLHDASTSV